MQLLLVKIGGNTSSNSNGPSILLNSSVPSTIKYAKIINSNVTQNWLLSAQDGSTIENSEFSGGAYGVTLSNNSTIKDSKIYNFKYNGLELNNATATGNIIYDVNNNSDTDSGGSDVNLQSNSTFTNNKLYSPTERNDNTAIWVDGDNTTIEYNTIGGSSGIHGAVGISMAYNRNSTIRYNNIGGYLANIALHGIDNNQNYTFTDNNFIGTLW